MNPFVKLTSELKRLQTGYREESYYRPLCDFLESYATEREFLHMLNVVATNNPSTESVGEGIGFPDIEVRKNRRLIGYIEVKSPNQSLDNPAFSFQFNRYRDSLENVIFTNFKKWILYTWDKDGKPQKTEEAEWDYLQDINTNKLKKLITVFFEGQSYQAKTPHQLAIALARKTKLLSQQVEEVLIYKNPDKRLVDLKKTFEKTLIQDITDHQFANIYAETIAYSLFLSKLGHYEKGSNIEFTLRTAVDFLPKNVPIFKDLYQLTGGRVEPITPEIYKATEILIEQLNFADIEKIYKKLIEHKPGEDPVIQFYEPFLSEYDPEERKARGVYYTPKPVVDYIVRSVDFILKTKFNKQKGLGDESVQILDPATGTGTFLMSVIQNIYADIEKENKPLGIDLVKRKFNEVVSSHILKHLYGFELLVAPYAIAHLKLTLELERLGFNFSMTESDSDKENDRLKIFLANTLDNPDKKSINLFGFDSITEESERARLVKKDSPILVITGNPPYSGLSMNMSEEMRQWVEKYKYINGKKIVERGALQLEKNLNDDYIKFISFAQSQLEKVGFGVVALITNNGYLNNPTLRGLRFNLLTYFDELHFLNLHGNSKKKERVPLEFQKKYGITDKDENIFESVYGVGTTISFLVKYKNSKPKKVYYSELWGKRKLKWSLLQDFSINENGKGFEEIRWENINPKPDNYYFIPKDEAKEAEYSRYFKITDAMPLHSIGVITSKDQFLIKYGMEEIKKNVSEFNNFNGSDDEICDTFNIPNKKGWDISKSRKLLNKEQSLDSFFQKILYRPFDVRFTFYHKSLIWSMAQPVMRNFINHQNIALITSRLTKGEIFRHILVSNNISEVILLSSKTSNNAYSFPLYVYDDYGNDNQASFLEKAKRRPNFSNTYVEEFSKKLSLDFTNDGKGNLETTFGAEDIFYYTYAILHSSSYRNIYVEQLKDDFPYIPISSDKNLFRQFVDFGNELVNLHLLGENPFDKSKTIFDDTSKWQISIGGEKPTNTEDWKVMEVRYDEKTKRVYANSKQYFEGIEYDVWKFMVGGYQVLEKWLKDRKKAGRILTSGDQIHYLKIVVSLRETIRIMKEIDKIIPEWPMK